LTALFACASLCTYSVTEQRMRRCIPFLLAILLLAGCQHHRRHREGQQQAHPIGPRQVTIQYLGHTCFLITSSLGLNILTDPFNPSVLSYPVKPGTVPADIIFVTHEDETANFTDLASGSPVILRSSMASGVNRANGVKITGVKTSSESLSATTKLNVAYVWSMDGIRFCDLGAIEDAITPTEAIDIGHVDVVFLPVGGPPNFTDQMRKTTIDRLQPKIVIPMMYSTAYSSKVPLRGLGEWLSRQSHVVRVPNQFILKPKELPDETTVFVPAVR
jgi:L-ascorbate metabolism protein UlaG (beta-lactamase superfamily)